MKWNALPKRTSSILPRPRSARPKCPIVDILSHQTHFAELLIGIYDSGTWKVMEHTRDLWWDQPGSASRDRIDAFCKIRFVGSVFFQHAVAHPGNTSLNLAESDAMMVCIEEKSRQQSRQPTRHTCAMWMEQSSQAQSNSFKNIPVTQVFSDASE